VNVDHFAFDAGKAVENTVRWGWSRMSLSTPVG
jgi:hypothetical protein